MPGSGFFSLKNGNVAAVVKYTIYVILAVGGALACYYGAQAAQVEKIHDVDLKATRLAERLDSMVTRQVEIKVELQAQNSDLRNLGAELRRDLDAINIRIAEFSTEQSMTRQEIKEIKALLRGK